MRCDASILHADLDSFYASVEQRDDSTLVGFAVSGIDRTGAQQLMLPLGEGSPSGANIDEAIDQVRRRYGKSALTPAVLVGRDARLDMPHLPD